MMAEDTIGWTHRIPGGVGAKNSTSSDIGEDLLPHRGTLPQRGEGRSAITESHAQDDHNEGTGEGPFMQCPAYSPHKPLASQGILPGNGQAEDDDEDEEGGPKDYNWSMVGPRTNSPTTSSARPNTTHIDSWGGEDHSVITPVHVQEENTAVARGSGVVGGSALRLSTTTSSHSANYWQREEFKEPEVMQAPQIWEATGEGHHSHTYGEERVDPVLGATPFQRCPARSVLGMSGGKGSFDREDRVPMGGLTPQTRRATGSWPTVGKGGSQKDDTEIGANPTHVAQGGQEHKGSRSTSMLRLQGDPRGKRKRRASPHSAPNGVSPKRRMQMSSAGAGEALRPERHSFNQLGGSLVTVDRPPGSRLRN